MRTLLPVLSIVVVAAGAQSQQPTLPAADRVRIAEAFRLARQIGEQVWPGWSEAPFALLLVTDSLEFLVRHPKPSDDFHPLGRDSLLESAVFVRKRVYAPDLLATFPAVTGVTTIVIGEPANTGKTSTEWVLTVLHEHFHQLEYAHPGYYAGVDSLRLSRGDQTGMWMLNYPFPYDSAPVATRFGALARVLARAVTSMDGNQRVPAATLTAYAEARAALQAALSADDYRYLSFQLWQEGVARYVEYRAAAIAAREYTPSPGFRALPDYADYGATAERLRRNLVRELMNADLAKDRRTDFYSVGAATALLLDAAAPPWKVHYFTPMFTLDPLLQRSP